MQGVLMGRWWPAVVVLLLWGCAGVPVQEVALEESVQPAAPEQPRPNVLRRVKTEAYASFAQGMLLETRSRRLVSEARRSQFLSPDEALTQEKRRQAVEFWVRARGALEQTVALDPEGLFPVRYLAFALIRRGDLEEAVPYLERTVALNPDDLRAHMELAFLCEGADRLEDALREYRLALQAAEHTGQEWLRRDLHAHHVHLHVVRLTERLQGLAAAVAPLSEALETYSEYPAVLGEVERLASAARKDDGFIERAEKVVPEESRGFGFCFLMGRIAFARQEWTTSVKYLDRAVEVKSDFLPAHLQRSLVLAELGRVEEALTGLEQARQNGLESVAVQALKGSILMGAHRHEEARELLEDAVRLAPRNILVRHQLAGVYESLGLLDEAIALLEESLTIRADHAATCNALGYFYAEKSVQLGEAEELVRRALRQEPDNGAYLDSLGWVFFTQGKLDEALKVLTEAAGATSDPVIYEHLGDVYLQQHQAAEAAHWGERALKLDPDASSARRKLEALGTVELEEGGTGEKTKSGE